MVWVIAYIVGMVATATIFSYMDSRYGNPDVSRDNAIGRLISIALWPIVLPFIIILWIKSRGA